MRSATFGLVTIFFLCGGCSRQEGGAPPAPDAPEAPAWSLRDVPASKDPPAYDLPLEITLDVPEVPSEIAGPSEVPRPSQEEEKKH